MIAMRSRRALSAHLCRCTGYSRILDGIQTAGEAWKNGSNFRARNRGVTSTLAKNSG